MYEILTSLRQLETAPIGKRLVVITKFRNGRDGIVDVCIQGPSNPVVSVEKSGTGYKAFASDTTWVRCATISEVFAWTSHKLAEIMAAQQLP